MALPEQVVNDARAADAMIAGVTGQVPAAPEAPGNPTGEDAIPPVTQQPQPGAPVEVQPDAAGVEHDWKERFSKLKTSRDATIHQQRQQMDEMRAQLQGMQEQLANKEVDDLKASVTSPVSSGEILTEDEITLMGEENLAIISKIVNHVVGVRVQDLIQYQDKRQQAADTQRQQEAAQQSEAQQRANSFKSKLTELVPDWIELDNDPAFNIWATETDEVSGTKRLDLMISAFQTHDVVRVAEFYNMFKATLNPPDPRGNQLLPDTSRSAPPPLTAGMPPGVTGKVWTTAEIDQFYKLRTLGKFKGREAEARAIEADIFAAQKQPGRIR